MAVSDSSINLSWSSPQFMNTPWKLTSGCVTECLTQMVKWSLSQLLEVSITGAHERQTDNAESWISRSFCDKFFVSMSKKTY